MRNFSIFVADDRYSVPTMLMAVVTDEARAIELAVDKLAETPHHLSVEVWEADALVFATDRTSAFASKTFKEQSANRCRPPTTFPTPSRGYQDSKSAKG